MSRDIYEALVHQGAEKLPDGLFYRISGTPEANGIMCVQIRERRPTRLRPNRSVRLAERKFLMRSDVSPIKLTAIACSDAWELNRRNIEIRGQVREYEAMTGDHP